MGAHWVVSPPCPNPKHGWQPTTTAIHLAEYLLPVQDAVHMRQLVNFRSPFVTVPIRPVLWTFQLLLLPFAHLKLSERRLVKRQVFVN